MKKIHFYSCAVALAALSLTACDDYLDLKPMNEIVKENYWTEKADVESVVNSCYAGLEADACLKRLFIYGELRSDNIVLSTSTPYALQQILNENLLETNEWVKWESLYQVINRCNTVIAFAPEVAERDPNYTVSELRATLAEVTALRALVYFYLVRTFRDVPYVTMPSLNDDNVEKDYRVSPTPMAEVIKALINDLEAVKGDALKLYPEMGYPLYDAANTSRVTNCFIYALLADLYLWDGDYERCSYYCDLVLEYKMARYEELKEEAPENVADMDLFRDKYPLLLEQPSGTTVGRVYNSVFGNGNSFESIFELYFLSNQRVENKLVSEFYGNTNTPLGNVGAADQLYTGIYENTNQLFKPTDCRVPEGIEERGSAYAIRKYYYSYVSITMNRNNTAPRVAFSSRSGNFANWVVYRLTDVMLMKAEAEVERQNFDDAFELVSTVYNRANNLTTASADTLSRSDYGTLAQMRELVLDERRRELMFEGKRWFDLVRYALRTGDNTYLIERAVSKQKERQSAIRIKLKSQDAIFWPYAKSELDANPKLTQNPAFVTNETSQK